MNAGRARTEIIIKRPGLDQVSLFAISVDELKVWFAEMKKVSDVRMRFIMFSFVLTGDGKLEWRSNLARFFLNVTYSLCTTFIELVPRLETQKRDSSTLAVIVAWNVLWR